MALGGMFNLVGSPEREPLLLGGYQAQYTTGMCAFTGTAAALLYLTALGRGQLVDVSAMESIAYLEWKSASNYEATGSVRRRTGDRSHNLVIRTRDGWFGLLYTDPNWPQVCELTGVAALHDERFSTRPDARRTPTRSRTVERLVRAAHQTRDLSRRPGLKVPAGMVATVDDLLESPQYAAREFWQTIDHPATGPLRYPGPAIPSAATRPRLNARRCSASTLQTCTSAFHGGIGHS